MQLASGDKTIFCNIYVKGEVIDYSNFHVAMWLTQTFGTLKNWLPESSLLLPSSLSLSPPSLTHTICKIHRVGGTTLNIAFVYIFKCVRNENGITLKIVSQLRQSLIHVKKLKGTQHKVLRQCTTFLKYQTRFIFLANTVDYCGMRYRFINIK